MRIRFECKYFLHSFLNAPVLSFYINEKEKCTVLQPSRTLQWANQRKGVLAEQRIESCERALSCALCVSACEKEGSPRSKDSTGNKQQRWVYFQHTLKALQHQSECWEGAKKNSICRWDIEDVLQEIKLTNMQSQKLPQEDGSKYSWNLRYLLTYLSEEEKGFHLTGQIDQTMSIY